MFLQLFRLKKFLKKSHTYLAKNHHTSAVDGPVAEVPICFAASEILISVLPPEELPSLIFLPSLTLHRVFPPEELPSLISSLLLILPRVLPPEDVPSDDEGNEIEDDSDLEIERPDWGEPSEDGVKEEGEDDEKDGE